jgi:opacity protein-like surface antigen
MKKILTSVVLLALFTGAAMAQSIYLRAGTGYGLPIATTALGEKYLRSTVSTTTATIDNNSTERVTGSYGSGIDFNIALGYKFNENFIFELSTQYLFSKKYKTADDYSYTGIGYSYVDNNDVTTSARALFINPSFIFSAGFGKAAPYGRFGFVIGSPKVSGKESYYYNGDGVDSTERKWEYSKGIALGFQGAIGMNWKLSEKLDIYTEINYLSMTYYAGEYNLTEDKNLLTGFNYLPNMSLSQKQTVYEKKFDPTKVNIDPAKPRTALRESTPFSSLSFQVGIRFALWKKAE